MRMEEVRLLRNLDHVGNLESLLDELGYMQYICVCGGDH